jgi:glucose-1-phosphate adenylyltransferase
VSPKERVRLTDILAIVMGGGRGTRLYPLVKYRCKPAVPLAGRYRLIDIPLSNCLHSGINRIFVLTQFNSRSLNNHVNRTYQFGPVAHGSVEIIAASQTEEGDLWFQGTADAVRRCLQFVDTSRTSHVLILSGDQLYAMNFQQLVATHEEKNAEITIACKDVNEQEAPRFGIMCTDENQQITDFVEKPQTEGDLRRVRSPEGRFWASLGIYLFDVAVLRRVLGEVKGVDFGRHVIPHAVRGDYQVAAHAFSGYWEDIGTIGSFYAANLGLVCPVPPIDLFDPQWTIYTRPRSLPPTKVERSAIRSVLLADGSWIQSASIRHSVVGIRTMIRTGTTIDESIVMGADYYVPDDSSSALPTMGIGRNVVIRRAIVDKNVRIGDGCRIVNEKKLPHADGPGWSIRDGIVVVEKNAVIPPGTVI